MMNDEADAQSDPGWREREKQRIKTINAVCFVDGKTIPQSECPYCNSDVNGVHGITLMEGNTA